MNASPLIKWVGGKRKLLGEIMPRIPDEFNTYVEPFVGGGAVLFAMTNRQPRPQNIVINDGNEEVANLYLEVQNDPERLYESLMKHENTPEYYTAMRDLDRSPVFQFLDPISRASRFLYLNKTAFNGIWRVNQKGQHNVPFGKYKTINLPSREELMAVKQALDGVKILHGDFSDTAFAVERGSFFYMDPPYVPLSVTASFDKYTGAGFDNQDHIRLREYCDFINDQGALFMMSNSDTEFVREQYKDYRIEAIQAHRLIGGKNSSRDKVSELIIRNY